MSVSKFPETYTTESVGFIDLEIERAERVMNLYCIALLVDIPLIITICSLAVIL
ncbi:MAG: hypothetical protein AAGF25_02045 [Pseudomonadota bacterium]